MHFNVRPVTAWQLFIYRLPGSPSRVRVAAWRELRRLGALPLQQGVVALPEMGDLVARLDAVERRVVDEGGEVHRFRLTELAARERSRLEDSWSALRRQEYAEIIEECKTKFAREVEFEIFRGNLTAGEAEEIEADLDKIRSWFDRIDARDWFHAELSADARNAIAGCERLLESFLERVYEAEMEGGPSLEPPAEIPWGTTSGALHPAEDDDRVVEFPPQPQRRSSGRQGGEA
jgi:hypothetical protein